TRVDVRGPGRIQEGLRLRDAYDAGAGRGHAEGHGEHDAGAAQAVRGDAEEAEGESVAAHGLSSRPGPAVALIVYLSALVGACARDRRTPVVLYSPHGRD